MERYIKEYANDRIKEINNNKLIQDEFKKQTIEQIKKSIIYRERGLITINETIKLILDA